jgi:hypothetical protein
MPKEIISKSNPTNSNKLIAILQILIIHVGPESATNSEETLGLPSFIINIAIFNDVWSLKDKGIGKNESSIVLPPILAFG